MSERPENCPTIPDSPVRAGPALIGSSEVRPTSSGLDILLTADGAIDASSAPTSKLDRDEPRPWIGVYFECCGVYSRVYRDPSVDRYDGRCPKCAVPLTVRVSPDGVSTSFVRARVV